MQPTVDPTFGEQPQQEWLAEVIPLDVGVQQPSFYQRNSGALPRIGKRSEQVSLLTKHMAGADETIQ